MNITRVGGDVVNIEECEPGTFVRFVDNVTVSAEVDINSWRRTQQSYLNSVMRAQERKSSAGTYVHEISDEGDETVHVSATYPLEDEDYSKRGAWVDFGTQVEIIREP